MNTAATGILALSLLALTSANDRVARGDEVPASDSRLRVIQQELKMLPKLIPSLQTHRRIGFHGHAAEPAWVIVDFGRVVTPEKIVLFPARPAIAGDPPSAGFPSSLQIDISSDKGFSTSVHVARWKEEAVSAGERIDFLSFKGNGTSGRFLRIRVTGFRDDPLQPSRQYYRLGEVIVLERGQNVALSCPVTSTASTEISRRWEARNLTDGYLWCLPLRGPESSPTNGYRSEIADRAVVSDAAWVEVDLGVSQPIDEVHLVTAYPRDFADQPGFGFPTHFRVLADAGTADATEILNELEPPYPGEALPNPGSAQLMFATPGLTAQRIRITCEALWRRGPGSGRSPEEYLMAMSELQVWREGKNLAAGRPVEFSSSSTEPGWTPTALTDGYSSREELLDWPAWLTGIERAEALRAELRHVQLSIQIQRETLRQRLLWGAIGSTLVISLLGLIGFLWLRARAARVQEELRSSIARDLHDEIGASLSHLALQSDLAQQQLLRGELGPERLAAISAGARQTLDHMRDVIWLLVPRASNWSELSHRLQSISSRILDGVKHEIVVEGEPPEGKPAIEWSRNVVTFLKEVLTNARRHSEAENIRVSFDWGETLVMEVEDNGRGFDIAASRDTSGTGLENLEQRAALLRASLDIRSGPGEGTTVRLSVPFSKG